ncbi:MAG: hypothetical protein RL186_853 [Pseudomonadota bacterium]|jgi:hypothetical protein
MIADTQQDETDSAANADVEALLDDARLGAANIIPTTRLATDYLNVFNEVVMLIGLLPDMPEMMDDLRHWQFLTYEQHFARSGLHTKDLAILAYQHAEPGLKQVFDAEVARTASLVADAIAGADAALAGQGDLVEFCARTCTALNDAISSLDSLVHGRAHSQSHEDIDAMFEG